MWVEEVDRQEVFEPQRIVPDFFGVRDVRQGYTFVRYETGERELYDLIADPYQLENRAEDPGYAAQRSALEARLLELLADPSDRQSGAVPE